jgi:hypothetical protein
MKTLLLIAALLSSTASPMKSSPMGTFHSAAWGWHPVRRLTGFRSS